MDRKIRKNKIEGINVDASYKTNNNLKSIYNSIDTTSITLIIDKKKIEKSKIKLILDTLNKQNYSVNIDRENRIIELIKN